MKQIPDVLLGDSGRYAPYPVYQDSGLEWLGQIPAHWEMKRMSELTTLVNGYPFDSEYFVRGEGIPLVRIRDLGAIETKVNYIGPVVENAWIESGDVIIGMDGDFNVARWGGQRALLNQRMCCLRPRNGTDAAFIAYAIPHPLRIINDLTYSTTVKHLSSLDVRKIRIGTPPGHEQLTISAFLDRETATIDGLAARKERLIELLQEKRTALITRAVTRGLDPDVAMKDSGVEWLGRIPADWEVRRLKFLLDEPLKYGASEPAVLMDEDLPRYIRITDVSENGRLREETFRSIPEHIARSYLLEEGDILFARSGATVGKSFRYEPSWGRAAHAGYLVRARLDSTKCDSRFVQYFLSSLSYWDWLRSNFIQATIQNVSAERYASLEVPVPGLDEQRAIVAYLDHETAKIDALITMAREAIDLLKEFRTALISAAVTGKIDVREEAA